MAEQASERVKHAVGVQLLCMYVSLPLLGVVILPHTLTYIYVFRGGSRAWEISLSVLFMV